MYIMGHLFYLFFVLMDYYYYLLFVICSGNLFCFVLFWWVLCRYYQNYDKKTFCNRKAERYFSAIEQHTLMWGCDLIKYRRLSRSVRAGWERGGNIRSRPGRCRCRLGSGGEGGGCCRHSIPPAAAVRLAPASSYSDTSSTGWSAASCTHWSSDRNTAHTRTRHTPAEDMRCHTCRHNHQITVKAEGYEVRAYINTHITHDVLL